jgi:chemosensory pili system protein ChpA (sensor histidine kinase/response regulator)
MNKQPPELDPELRRLFIEEAEQKANEISKGIAEFNELSREQPQALDRMVWLQMRFAEYSGIASTLGLQRSGRAGALVVDELTQVIGGARDAEDSLPSLFDAALEAIDDALEYLHGENIDPERIFESDEHEPTVAAQLPTLDFPQLTQSSAAAPTSSAPANDTTLVQQVPEGIDSSLYEIFMDEANELLTLANHAWDDWQQQRNQQDAINELRRVFHTLKGGARLTQMLVLGDYLHAAEDWMEEANEPAKVDALKTQTRTCLNQLAAIFDALSKQQTASFPDHGGKPSVAAVAPETAKHAAPPTKVSAPGPSSNEPASKTMRSYVRVRTETLEALRLRASEVNALRNQIQQIATALETEQALTTQTLQEARNTLRNGRFALERLIDKLPRQEASVNDAQLESQMALQQLEDVILRLNRQNDRSADLCSHAERALAGQSKAGYALQENILNTRLVPFSDYHSRLIRIVQQTAAEMGSKQAQLEIEGADTDVDRRLMEQLLPALEHMLRNAVVHGIETAEQRRQLGKPVVGTVRLALRKSRGKLEVDLSDDGAGLALSRIKEKALALGVISADETLSQRRLERLIFHPGLSAADQVDQLAGRGVGMDVVEHTVHELGGNIDLSSETNRGTRFQLRLPMGETSLTAVIVHIADELYAIPQQDIRSIQRLDDQTLSRGYQEDIPIAWNGNGWQIKSLGHWLGLGEGRLPGPRQSLPALLIQTEGQHHAVVVDYCGDSAEYNLETLPAAVTGILGINAAVILEDGQIAPVLDLPALCKSQVVYTRQALQLAAPDPNQRYRVMIIDDSTTWLRQLSRGLARYPLDIVSCKDGQEALSTIEEQQPQLLIVDLEMPRMDGLEFLRRLRRNPKLINIPAIMFSTVTGSNQRNRARQLGAKAWVTKNANLRPLLVEIDRQLGSQFARHLTDETG